MYLYDIFTIIVGTLYERTNTEFYVLSIKNIQFVWLFIIFI